jgi:N-methylhydantoinase B
MTSTGAGWGDPKARDLELIEADLKNGYITVEQANKYYEYDKRGGNDLS